MAYVSQKPLTQVMECDLPRAYLQPRQTVQIN